MNEDFFQNFWVSWDKPDNLSENWLWVKDIFDITTLIKAYRILYPNGKALDDIHYICLPINDKSLIEFIYEDVRALNYVFIWRPSCIGIDMSRPKEETEISWEDTLMILDNCDYFGDEEDDDCYEEEDSDE